MSDLTHHGIKGMKWGVRKNSSSSVSKTIKNNLSLTSDGKAVALAIIAVNGAVVVRHLTR